MVMKLSNAKLGSIANIDVSNPEGFQAAKSG